MVEQLRVGDTFRSSLNIETDPLVELEFNRRVHMLEAFVLAEKLAEDAYSNFVSFQTPTTTWQMFKQTHAESWWLGWLVRRRPINFKTTHVELMVKVKRYASYPEANVPIEKLGRPVPWEIVATEINKTEEH